MKTTINPIRSWDDPGLGLSGDRSLDLGLRMVGLRNLCRPDFDAEKILGKSGHVMTQISWGFGDFAGDWNMILWFWLRMEILSSGEFWRTLDKMRKNWALTTKSRLINSPSIFWGKPAWMGALVRDFIAQVVVLTNQLRFCWFCERFLKLATASRKRTR